jgi:hypothetical protein
VPPFKWLDRFSQLRKALEQRVASLASDDANANADSNFYKRLWKIVNMLLKAKMPKDKGRLLRLMSSFIGAYFSIKKINRNITLKNKNKNVCRYALRIVLFIIFKIIILIRIN